MSHRYRPALSSIPAPSAHRAYAALLASLGRTA